MGNEKSVELIPSPLRSSRAAVYRSRYPYTLRITKDTHAGYIRRAAHGVALPAFPSQTTRASLFLVLDCFVAPPRKHATVSHQCAWRNLDTACNQTCRIICLGAVYLARRVLPGPGLRCSRLAALYASRSSLPRQRHRHPLSDSAPLPISVTRGEVLVPGRVAMAGRGGDLCAPSFSQTPRLASRSSSSNFSRQRRLSTPH